MKTLPAAILATLMTTTLALGIIVPTSAQDAPASAPMAQPHHGGKDFGHFSRPMQRGNGDFLNVQRGAEAVEVGLVRLAHRLDLTDDQKPLLDALKAAALTAATDFEAVIKDLRPTPPTPPTDASSAEAPPAPDFSKNLDTRIAIGKANVTALEAIKPSYDAFFGSLTDDQKAKLTERPDNAHSRGDRGHRPGFDRK